MRSTFESEQHAQARAGIFDVFGHVERGEFWLLTRAVFESLPVEGEAFVLFAGFFFGGFGGRGRPRHIFFVEAAFGFVAQPFAIEHLREEIRQAKVTAFVVDVCGHVADDVAEDVQSHQINGAESCGFRPADGLSGERVDVFDAEVHLLHEAHHVQHRKGADTVGDEVGSVFGKDDAFAEAHVAEVRDEIDQRGVGLWGGNEFEQAHVARRIEEVGAEPGAAEIVGEAFGNFADGQAAGVGGDDGAGLADGFDFAQQGALEVEIFDDGFDDPVDFGELLQIIFEIADGDEAGERRIHECGGLGFFGGIETGGGDFVARGRVCVGWDICGNDIEQIAGNAGVGEVGGDAGAHGSGAEDGYFINALHHLASRIT